MVAQNSTTKNAASESSNHLVIVLLRRITNRCTSGRVVGRISPGKETQRGRPSPSCREALRRPAANSSAGISIRSGRNTCHKIWVCADRADGGIERRQVAAAAGAQCQQI